MTIHATTCNLIQPGKAIKLLACLALGGILLIGILVLLPNRDYYRWQQGDGTILFRARYIYERIHFDPRPIDVAMIGSSRMEASVRRDELSAGLSAGMGYPVNVVNFGIPQEGRDLQWAVTEQLLNTRPEVKLIVLTAGSETVISHPGFRFLGDDQSILSAPIVYNRHYFENLLTVPYRRFAYFLQGLSPYTFRLSTDFDPTIYRALDFDPSQTFTTADGVRVDRDRVMDVRKFSEVSIGPGADYDPKLRLLPLDQRYAIERSYLRRIATLAKEKGVMIVFLRVPTYRGAAERFDDKKFYTDIGLLLEATQVADDHRNYMDAGHLNRNGTAILSPWLVDKLVLHLKHLEKRKR